MSDSDGLGSGSGTWAKISRLAYLTVCCQLAVIGVFLSFVSSLPMTLVLFTVACVVVGDLAMNFVVGRDETNPELRNVLGFVVQTSLLGGTACVALAGLKVQLGAWGLLAVVGVVTGGSPYLIRLGGRRLHRRPATSPPLQQGDAIVDLSLPVVRQRPVAIPHYALRSWSDLELCRAWCASYLALQETESQRIVIVTERQRYLDEFARRNPEGMMAWLASGARAGASPGRYLIQGAIVTPRSIDWDQLVPRTDS
jgi:hypothetical protein